MKILALILGLCAFAASLSVYLTVRRTTTSKHLTFTPPPEFVEQMNRREGRIVFQSGSGANQSGNGGSVVFLHGNSAPLTFSRDFDKNWREQRLPVGKNG